MSDFPGFHDGFMTNLGPKRTGHITV